MGVTAALHLILVGNPIHIDCDRNSHTAFVLIVMHKMHTCIFKTGAGQIKKVFLNFLAMA